MTSICMKLKRFAFFIQKVIILSFLATRTKKEQSFTRPSSLKKEVAKQYHHTMADYSYYTWVVSSKVGASRGRNIKLVIWNTQGRQKLCFSPTTVFFCFFYFEILCVPSEIPANLPGQFSRSGQNFCTGSSNSEGPCRISK